MISLREIMNVAERERFTEVGFPLDEAVTKLSFLNLPRR